MRRARRCAALALNLAASACGEEPGGARAVVPAAPSAGAPASPDAAAPSGEQVGPGTASLAMADAASSAGAGAGLPRAASPAATGSAPAVDAGAPSGAPLEPGAPVEPAAPLEPVPAGATFTVSVNLLGAGRGRVTSSPLGIDCSLQTSATCSAAFAEGTTVVLRASPENGSDTLLGDWSLSYCARFRDCSLPPLALDQTIEVTFEPMPANVAFVNADTVPTNLGSARAYDAVCNASATRAGLNNLTGDRFVAVVSDETESFRARLGTTASGWVLADGRPFAGTIEQLLDEQRVFNALDLSEQGTPRGAGLQRVLTNTLPDGTGASFERPCENFTSLTGAFRGGEVIGGPGAWIDFAPFSCGRNTAFLYCMGRDRSVDLQIAPAPGLRIWLSNEPYHPGTADGTPDEHCRAGLPPGVADARALIARAESPASAVLDMASAYVRPDGVLVGTGSDIVSLFQLKSGIWQAADCRYVPRDERVDAALATAVWTGSQSLTALALPEATCADWTSSTGAASSGAYSLKSDFFWYGASPTDCGKPGGAYLYCVEPAP